MKRINGNKTLNLQTYSTTKNEIGERIKTWTTADTLTGFLDLSNGDSKYTLTNAKTEESTHLFITPYKQLGASVKTQNCRLFEPQSGKVYDVLLIDNPMELNEHLEFYLKYAGE